jgi:hypothetical protein
MNKDDLRVSFTQQDDTFDPFLATNDELIERIDRLKKIMLAYNTVGVRLPGLDTPNNDVDKVE